METNFIEACRQKDIKKIREIITHLYDQRNVLIQKAASIGDISIMDFLVDHGVADMEIFFHEACKNGYTDIVKRLEPKYGRGSSVINFGLYTASRFGHKDIVKILIDRHNAYVEWVLSSSCKYNHVDILELAISKGACNWNSGLFEASSSGHLHIVKLMLSKDDRNTNDSLEIASTNGHLDVVKYLVANGAKKFNRCLIVSSANGHIDIVKFLLTKGATNLKAGISEASRGHYPEIVNLLMTKLGYMPENIKIDNSQIYYLFKSRVLPSERYKKYYNHLTEAENITSQTLSFFLIPDILSIVNSY